VIENVGLPMVSVVVTAYNVRPFIAETLRSVISQPYSNFEVIVIDDGSTDGTAEILESWSSEPRVRIIRQANKGSSSARNAGARAAKGEFLAFIDGDDLATPQRLQSSIAALREYPDSALSYGRIDLIDETGHTLSRRRSSRYRSGWIAGELRYRNFIPFSAITVRQCAFEQIGGFDESIRSSEDWEFLWRLATKFEVRFVDECLILYRVRAASKTMDIEAKAAAYRSIQERMFEGNIPRIALASGSIGLGSICLKRGEALRALSYFCRALAQHPGVAFLYRSEIYDRFTQFFLRRNHGA
jgi:glycosyltransferase involved in cell wall biosynthesis